MYDLDVDFEKPLTIYQDGQNALVKFYGKWNVIKEQFYTVLASPINTKDGEELAVTPNPLSTLQFKQEIFDNFSDIELRLYPEKINKVTIKGNVINSTAIATDVTDRDLVVGDKLFIDNTKNEIVTAKDNFAIHDVQDATVANSAYSTSGNGGRKLARLDNGWLVAFVKDSTRYRSYKSLDNGLTWLPSVTLNFSSLVDFSVVSLTNNLVYILFTANNDVLGAIIDIENNAQIGGLHNICTTESSVGKCSLIMSYEGMELHACWSSKNSKYPNSFNIRYVKGTINEDDGITWGSVEQRTIRNTIGQDLYSPTIVIREDNNPVIMYVGDVAGNNYVLSTSYNGTSWSGEQIIHNGGSYDQSLPSAIFVPQNVNGLTNGRIWIVWHGSDSTIGTNNPHIKISYSDDGGVTWSATENLTKLGVENTNNTAKCPSITADKNNVIYIIFDRDTTGTLNRSISLIKWESGSYSSIQDIKGTDSSAITNPSLLFDKFTLDFSVPLFIYENNEESRVGFYGTWKVEEGYTLEMTDSVTLTDGQQVPIIDFNVEQDDVPLTLKNIDVEKYEFDISSLNTTTSDIKVNGKENSLNSVVYAIS